MTAITPSLHYRWLSECGQHVIGEGPPLHTVQEVSVYSSSGDLTAWARGRMLRRDGQPGPSRGRQVDIDAPQPAWLRQILADAHRRLESGSPSTEGGA